MTGKVPIHSGTIMAVQILCDELENRKATIHDMDGHGQSYAERAGAILDDIALQVDSLETRYRKAAIAEYHYEGRIEIDEKAAVSRSENGAYVMAWVWIDEETIRDD